MKITVMAPALTYALTAVIPHALADGSIAPLGSVGLQVRDGRLYVSATDRYTLGIAHLPTVDKSDAEFEAIVDLSDTRQLLQIVKLAQAQVGRLIETEITLTVEKDFLVVATMWKNHMLRLRRADQVTPALRWEHFLPSFLDGGTGDALTSFDPAHLAKFVKAMPHKGAKMITYQPKGTKPAFVAVGDSFFGFVMPQRVEFAELEAVLPQAAGGTRPNTETEEVEAKAAQLVQTAPNRFDVVITPGAPPKDEDAPDLSDKKPATVRPAAKAKTLAQRDIERDQRHYAAEAKRAAAKKPARKAPVKRAPGKVA